MINQADTPNAHDGEVVAVLDIDSPTKGRFAEDDLAGLLEITRIIEEKIRWD